MRLLIVTQKVDLHDSVLGFFHLWIEKLAQQVDKLVVVCLEKGEYNLPPNVKVLSLGKESGQSRFKYLWRFFSYIWRERNNYDVVLSHMNPEYILLGWPVWKVFGKKIMLWYAHGHVNLILRIAAKMVNFIFTSTKGGCRLNNQKIKVIGQGIDIDFFSPAVVRKQSSAMFKIVSIGRLSPVKNYETLIKAVEIIVTQGFIVQVDIIGGVGLPKDKAYLAELKEMTAKRRLGGIVNFLGSVPNREILSYLWASDLFVNMSHTGSLDKAVLEAMSCGLPILTCNEALEEALNGYKDVLMYPKGDFMELATKIKMIINLSDLERQKMSVDLRNIVVANHSIENFIKKIIEVIK